MKKSYFEGDERGKNGREKREEGRISERGCGRGNGGDTGKHDEHIEKRHQGTNFHQKQLFCLLQFPFYRIKRGKFTARRRVAAIMHLLMNRFTSSHFPILVGRLTAESWFQGGFLTVFVSGSCIRRREMSSRLARRKLHLQVLTFLS